MPASTTRYAVSVPCHGPYAEPSTITDLARDAEGAGWDGFFVWDHIGFSKGFAQPIADPWVLLSAIAARTERIRLGPMVTPVARRRPWKLARETTTLDHLSNGRLTFGVGLGYPVDSEFEQFGEPGDRTTHARRLDEGLAIVDGLWSGEPFSFDGDEYRLTDVQFIPRPLQRPRIPVWVGGYWPNRAPFERAARWDGVFPGRLSIERRARWTPSPYPLEEFKEIVQTVKRARGAKGNTFDFVIGGYTSGFERQGDADHVDAYVALGLTWWVENLHGYRGDFAAMQRRVRLGPPKL